jgi:XRE family aerobic/anaerobic benzoate catabolism transcriptional regulator
VGQVESGQANISVANLAEVAAALSQPLAAFFDGLQVARAPADGVIALLGLRGAGKSTVGALLAKKISTTFHELDGLVELEAGMKLSELFAMHGEEYFRQAEQKALKRFLDTHPRGVLATGGGLVTSGETYELLLSRAHTVWLKAAPEEHWSRVVRQGDLRPMQNRPQAMAELKRRLKEREPQWARAEVSCLTSRRSVEEVVRELAAWGKGPATSPSLPPLQAR